MNDIEKRLEYQRLRFLFDTYAAHMQMENVTGADAILDEVFNILDKARSLREDDEDVTEHVCPHCSYTPVTSAIKDGICPNCLKSGIVSPDEEEDIITTVVIKLTRKQIMTNAVAHHIFHSAIELQIMAKELGDKSLTKEEYDQLRARTNVMFAQKLKMLNIDPPEMGDHVLEAQRELFKAREATSEHMERSKVFLDRAEKLESKLKEAKLEITRLRVWPYHYLEMTKTIENDVHKEYQKEFKNRNKRLRAALEWWFGTVMICNADGRITHQLIRTRHEGWICVKSIPGETFFGYLKHGAKTYMNAIDAILGAFDKYKESKSQETA